jgi:acetyl esterase/lipase
LFFAMPLFKMISLGLGLTLALAAVLAARFPVATLNGLAPASTYSVQTGLAYGDGPRRLLDVYRPTRAAPPGGWPMVVFFYGGTWNSGSRSDYAFVGEALASRGVLTLIADYRLYPEVRYPDFLRDSASALAWGLEHARGLGANPNKVFVMGHSAGAYNAAMLALDPRWLSDTGHAPRDLAGFIGLAGPYDFLPMTDVEAQPVFFHPNYPEGSQPLAYASAGAPRTFLGAAGVDPLVNPERNSVGLSTQLQAAGVSVTLRLYPRINHSMLIGAFGAPLRWIAPALDDVDRFIHETP